MTKFFLYLFIFMCVCDYVFVYVSVCVHACAITYEGKGFAVGIFCSFSPFIFLNKDFDQTWIFLIQLDWLTN